VACSIQAVTVLPPPGESAPEVSAKSPRPITPSPSFLSPEGGRRGIRAGARSPVRRPCVPGWGATERREAGMSLLEVLIAVSLLGISFVSIFSGLSAGLRATGRLDLFDRANEFAVQKLNELFLDASLRAEDRRYGTTPSGIRWEATTELVEKRPLPGSDSPAQLVRIVLQVYWRTPRGRQTLNFETLKLVIPEPPPAPSGP